MILLTEIKDAWRAAFMELAEKYDDVNEDMVDAAMEIAPHYCNFDILLLPSQLKEHEVERTFRYLVDAAVHKHLMNTEGGTA